MMIIINQATRASASENCLEEDLEYQSSIKLLSVNNYLIISQIKRAINI